MAHDASGQSMFPPVPGFDFLQGLVKKNTAGVGLPGLNQWVAPTLDPEEVEKRIAELKAVQFWLEQNARMLAATIQALEVQRMTLSTLKTMNVRMGDLRDALTARVPDGSDGAKSAPAPAPAPGADPAKAKSMFQMPSMFGAAPPRDAGARAPEAPPPAAAPAPAATPQPPAEAGAAAVDAMQWWSALTQQFADLAASAMRDGAEATQKLAGMIPVGAGDPAQAEAAAAARDAAAGQGGTAPAPGAAPRPPAKGAGSR